MDPSAHVNATEALIEFRASLCTFADLAKDALGTVDLDIQHTMAWLDEQSRHWQAAVRRAEDEVFQAKNELARKRMMRIGDRRPDTTDQEKILERAKARLEFAQTKLAASKRWLRVLPEEVNEYAGPARQLQGLLEGQFPRMIAYMEGKIASLEEYLRP